jgi:hypothetical protein
MLLRAGRRSGAGIFSASTGRSSTVWVLWDGPDTSETGHRPPVPISHWLQARTPLVAELDLDLVISRSMGDRFAAAASPEVAAKTQAMAKEVRCIHGADGSALHFRAGHF